MANKRADLFQPIGRGATLLTFAVGAAEAGQRLDRFLAGRLPDISRSRLQTLLRLGEVRRSRTVVSSLSSKVKLGETYELTLPAAEPSRLEAQAIPLNVVYEDAHLI